MPGDDWPGKSALLTVSDALAAVAGTTPTAIAASGTEKTSKTNVFTPTQPFKKSYISAVLTISSLRIQ